MLTILSWVVAHSLLDANPLLDVELWCAEKPPFATNPSRAATDPINVPGSTIVSRRWEQYWLTRWFFVGFQGVGKKGSQNFHFSGNCPKREDLKLTWGFSKVYNQSCRPPRNEEYLLVGLVDWQKAGADEAIESDEGIES
jgi:hypothetical protein